MPEHMLKPDGTPFDQPDLDALNLELIALSDTNRTNYRNANAATIAQSTHERVLIVAGPGTGKSTIFTARIKHWLGSNPGQKIYVTSFVNKLVTDLSNDIQTSRGLTDDEKDRVQVTTLHGFARSILERGNGSPALPLRQHIRVISHQWAEPIWGDVLYFHPTITPANHTADERDKLYYNESAPPDANWRDLLETFSKLRRFYNAVGFADSIVLAQEALESNPDLNEHQLWIVDEFQDFNKSEDHLIRTSTGTANGVLVAGDDDQALYQELRSSHPDIIQDYYQNDANSANAMLPYCGRCSYHVCAAASAFIAANRDATSIPKIYLPMKTGGPEPKVQVIACPTSASAVDYIARFIDDHRAEIEERKEKIEAGTKKDPFLLILTPAKNNRFYGRSAQQLSEMVDEWRSPAALKSADYQLLAAYFAHAEAPADNFLLRKLLSQRGTSEDMIHELVKRAIDSTGVLFTVGDPLITEIHTAADAVHQILSDNQATNDEKAQRLCELLSLNDQGHLAAELASNPIGVGAASSDENDTDAPTVSTISSVEMMAVVGSKGLSADHVIIIGFDETNFSRITPQAFYVGMTRARSSLHLIVALKSGGGTAPHDYLQSVPEQHCEFAVYKKTTGTRQQLADRSALEAEITRWRRATEYYRRNTG